MLHLSYTARNAGFAVRDAVREEVITPLRQVGTLLLTALQDFPQQWSRCSPAQHRRSHMLGQIKRLFEHGFRVFELVGLDEQLQQATHAGIDGAFLNLAPPE